MSVAPTAVLAPEPPFLPPPFSSRSGLEREAVSDFEEDLDFDALDDFEEDEDFEALYDFEELLPVL